MAIHTYGPSAIIATSSGDNTLIAGQSGKRIYVHGLHIQGSGTAVSCYLSSGTWAGTKLYGNSSYRFVIDKTGTTGPAGFCLNTNDNPWMITDVGEGLNLNLSAAQAVIGTVTYVVR